MVLLLGSSLEDRHSLGIFIDSGMAGTIDVVYAVMAIPFITRRLEIIDVGRIAFVRHYVSPPTTAPLVLPRAL